MFIISAHKILCHCIIMGSANNQVQRIIVLLIIFVIIYQVYNLTYRARYGDSLTNFKFFEVPDSIKCFFGEDKCDEGDIDGWTLCHGLMYFIIGLIVPSQYLLIILISIIFEMIQPYFGNSSRYIINPLVNLTGYAMGSILSPRHDYREKYKVFTSSQERT
jgi:hypothetical protein